MSDRHQQARERAEKEQRNLAKYRKAWGIEAEALVSELICADVLWLLDENQRLREALTDISKCEYTVVNAPDGQPVLIQHSVNQALRDALNIARTALADPTVETAAEPNRQEKDPSDS